METKSLFSTPEAKARILALYDEKLVSLGLETESKFVETSFGKTHLIVAGNTNNPPIVLLHGSNAGAAIALESVVPIVQDYCVYALDLPGQPNKSEGGLIPMKTEAYAHWLNEVLEQLNLNKIPVIGTSLGGLCAWKAAVYASNRISKIILNVPAGIVAGSPWVGLTQVFYPMKRYISTKKEKHLRKFLEALFTEEDPYAVKSLGLILPNFKMDFSPIPNIKEKEAAKVEIPVYIIGADQDKFFPGEKLIKRANKIFPNLQKTLLLKDSKHVLGKKHESQMHQFILGALKES